MDHRALWIMAASVLSSACGLEPVSRHVQLAAEDGWPRAQTAFVGDTLRVEVTRMEPLRASSVMYAWLITHQNESIRAGIVTPGLPTFFSGRTLRVDWTQILAVLITEESTADTPMSPSNALLFRGVPGSPLSPDIGGNLLGATATAHLQDDALTLTTTNLPLSGTRLFYGVWLMGSNTATPLDAGADAGADASADGGSNATFVGRVYGSGVQTFRGLVAPALRKEVTVTVEFESGVDAPALWSVVLRGTIPTTAVAPAGSGAAPAAPEPASHVH